MIADQDRSGWFGASDTAMICGNWRTKTFMDWWLKKLGLNTKHYTTRSMLAGVYYEHAILEHVKAPRRDHQIIIPELRLRVNLDGDQAGGNGKAGRIWEVKTYKYEKPFRVSKTYWQQVQVQMFAKLEVEKILPETEITSYGLLPEDYCNFFREIDPARVGHHPIGYDPAFIRLYLDKLAVLRDCMIRGVFPT